MIKSAAKPSTYGYPPNLEEKKKEDKEKVSTAVLSITNKQKKKDAEKKKGKEGDDKMDVDEKKDEKTDEPEPNFEHLSNPARVMKAQLKVVSLEDVKYQPIKDISIGGVIMLNRAKLGSDEKEEIVEPILVNKGGSSTESEEEEPAPPEPFQFTED